MPAPRCVYGLYSSDDDVIRYVGSTTKPLAHRLETHKSAMLNTNTPVAQWLRGTCRQGHRARIVALIERAGPAAEHAEIVRRLSLGEPLLNVKDGGVCPPSARPAMRTRVDAEPHRRADAGVALALPAEDAELGAVLVDQPRWMAFRDALRPIVPREPLHPYNRTPSQVAALAAKRAARVARQEAA